MKATVPLELIVLNEDDAPTLQARLLAAIVRAILRSRARPGSRLPSSRKLADFLGISRMTVTLVFQELISLGYLEAQPRSGVMVATTVPHQRLQDPIIKSRGKPLDWDDWLADNRLPKILIRKPVNWREYTYPFIYGQLDPDLFDLNAWRDCARRVHGTKEFGALAADQYGIDDPLLIDYICSNTLPRRGISAKPEEVLVTLGAQNGLFLAIELLARTDRIAATEEPGYPDFAEALRRAQSPTAFVPVDEMGLDLTLLPPNTRLVIVTPSHHIPTGATMPLDRRRDLIARAERQDFLIIEDDYDFEMSYLSPPEPALKSLDPAGRVIYLGSFSKSLFPGLRIGYMVGPAEFIEKARSLRGMILRHPPSHLQRITAYFLAYGHYDAHMVKLRGILKKRRIILEDALSKTSLEIAGTPKNGGTSVWIKGPDELNSELLAQNLRQSSVLIEPGTVFFENPPTPCPFFRLGFSFIKDEFIANGIKLINQQVKRALSDLDGLPFANHDERF